MRLVCPSFLSISCSGTPENVFYVHLYKKEKIGTTSFLNSLAPSNITDRTRHFQQ
ncbi:hypothetical protein bcere0022_34840 [Bacillus cereus Rock3-44]|nr:hypothetical protein bcere0022_34840 [Bacillus cereus Rock3-44]